MKIILRAASTTEILCAVITEQRQDFFLMMSLQVFARMFLERGVLFIFHNQH